jgi:hypothetical protein
LFLIQIVSIIFSAIIFTEISNGADDFGIDNEINIGKITVQSKTYFLENDFLGLIENNGEITYYNASIGSFTLLAPSLRIQTQLSVYETKREVDVFLNRAYSSKVQRDPLYEFIAKPNFKIERNNNSNQIALQSHWADYKITTETFSDQLIAKRYFDFCNNTCYLNYRITGSYGQVLRLEVNRILQVDNKFPKKIVATFYPSGKTAGKNEETVTSSHKLIIRLTDSDKTKINNVRNSMNIFKTVKFNEYQKAITEQITNSQQKK